MTKIKILYIEDQQEMIDGLKPQLEGTDFQPEFTGFKNKEQLKKKIIDFCPDAIISDDDIGGKSYASDISNAVSDVMTVKKQKIILVGCSAFANASSLEPDYKKIGFDRFFDNEGSPEQLQKITDYIKKSLKKSKSQQ